MAENGGFSCGVGRELLSTVETSCYGQAIVETGSYSSTCVLFTWLSDGTRMHCVKTTSWWSKCDALGSVLLGNPELGIPVCVKLT